MTAQQAPGREPEPTLHAVLEDGDACVFGAAWRETACRGQERRHQALIEAERTDGNPREPAHDRGPGTAASACRICPSSDSNGTVRAAGRPMITSAARAGAAVRAERNASRRRRRARLRCTAFRSCRLTANPTRVGSSASRHSTMSAGRSMRLPRWKSAWNSARVVSRCRRGSPPVRQSAVFGPSLDGASTLFGRPSSSFARESRVSWLVGADWVETSVSSRRSPFSIVEPNQCRHAPEPSQPTNALATAQIRVLVFDLRCLVLMRCAVLMDGRPGTDSQLVPSCELPQAIHICG